MAIHPRHILVVLDRADLCGRRHLQAGLIDVVVAIDRIVLNPQIEMNVQVDVEDDE